MAQTVDKFNGDLLIIDLDGNAIAHSTDATLTVSRDTPETTTKDSGGWKEYLKDGNRGWEMSASGLVTFDAANNSPADMLDSILNNTAVTVKFTTANTGDEEFTGSAILNSWSENSPQNAPASYEVAFTGDGALTKAVIV